MVNFRQIIFSLLGSQLFPKSTNNVSESHEHRTIAIVGAGTAGLAMLKTLREIPEYDAWNVVLFEERENVGGIWLPEPHPWPPPTLPKTPLYPGLRSISAAPIMTYPNLPFPAGTRLFPSHEELESYLVSIAQKHDLLPYIRLNYQVLNASWVGTPEAGVWNVTFLNQQNETHYNIVEHLVDATGKSHTPHMPSWPGQDEWLAKTTKTGDMHREILHSAWYRGPEKYRNKSILIVGDSYTGREVAAQTAPFVSKIFVSIRATNGRDRKFGPLPPNVLRKPEISHFTRDSVVFVDNTTIDVNSVILATGYRLRKAFLEAGNTFVTSFGAVPNHTETQTLVSNTRYIFPLYKHIFSLSSMYPPTALAFIGLVSVNGTWHTNVAQSMFVAHALLNPSLLPSRQEMLFDLALQEEMSRNAGIDPYIRGHIMPDGDWASDYQDELVDYLKTKGAIENDGKKFVEEWRRKVYKYQYLKRGWKRIEKLREGDEWVKSISTEEEWSDLMRRVDMWEKEYEEERNH